MSIASEITSPLKCNSSRSNEVSTLCESVPGAPLESSAGIEPWNVMIAPTPALTALLNGTSSTLSSRARDTRTTGSARCEFVPVSPCPGKCFPVAIIPCSWTPRMNAAPSCATSAGSSPNERVLMTGLAGLLLTSRIGEKSI